MKDEIRLLKAKLKTKLDVEKIFIFGSYAKGTFTPDSDIDVCIIANKVANNFLATMTTAPIAALVDARIETVVFSKDDYLYDCDFGLLKEVKTTGVIQKTNPEKRGIVFTGSWILNQVNWIMPICDEKSDTFVAFGMHGNLHFGTASCAFSGTVQSTNI